MIYENFSRYSVSWAKLGTRGGHFLRRRTRMQLTPTDPWLRNFYFFGRRGPRYFPTDCAISRRKRLIAQAGGAINSRGIVPDCAKWKIFGNPGTGEPSTMAEVKPAGGSFGHCPPLIVNLKSNFPLFPFFLQSHTGKFEITRERARCRPRGRTGRKWSRELSSAFISHDCRSPKTHTQSNFTGPSAKPTTRNKITRLGKHNENKACQ